MILILILNSLFALTFIIGKEIIKFSQPFFFIGFRMILAGSIILIYQHFLGYKFKFTKNDWIFFLKLSLVHIYFPYAFEFWSLQYVTAAKTALLFNLSPFITAVFIYILFKEKITLKKFLGLCIGIAGFLPILLSSSPQEKVAGEWFNISLPEILIICAVMSSAYAWILIQANTKKHNSFAILNGLSMLGGGILAFISSIFLETWKPIPVFEFKKFIFFTTLIIIIGNFICYNLYAYLLKRYTATFLSFAGFSIPIFTAIFQFIFFKTGVSKEFFVTAIFVFIGLSIFYQEELRSGVLKS